MISSRTRFSFESRTYFSWSTTWSRSSPRMTSAKPVSAAPAKSVNRSSLERRARGEICMAEQGLTAAPVRDQEHERPRGRGGERGERDAAQQPGPASHAADVEGQGPRLVDERGEEQQRELGAEAVAHQGVAEAPDRVAEQRQHQGVAAEP